MITGYDFSPRNIGEQIVILRTRSHMNRQQLASLAGITRQGLEQIESGRVSPRLVTIAKILAALNCRPVFHIEPIEDGQYVPNMPTVE